MTHRDAPNWLPVEWSRQSLATGPGFSLAETCGPVAWAAGRWPDLDWRDGCLIRVENGADGVVTPVIVWPGPEPDSLMVASPTSGAADRIGLIINIDRRQPSWEDPVIARLAERFPGLRPFAHGSVFLGLLTSIIGQSISVASAATTQRRLASLLADPVEIADRTFWPLPTAERLAGASPEMVRSSGVTWRRAEALVAIGRLAADGMLPDAQPGWEAASSSERIAALRELPLVGPWTARSTLLWGVADDSIWPSGDVALLRAARLAYGDPALELRDLVRLADGWGTAPGWATRLLWTGLFGAAPATISPS